MNTKVLHRAFGLLSFLTATITYMLTVQPTVPFWDCGEFSAASVWQQVPHPPGAPLFLMIGKMFHLLIPFGDPGWRVNLAAVFSSAFAILLVYLITVKIIENFKDNKVNDFATALATYGSAFIAAAAFTFSDTNWFNAVESEVYATSTLFVALVIYLMMKWNEHADEPGHERYLMLIAYLIGLSTGVHLLAVLTVFTIAMVVYFRKYEYSHKSFVLMGIIAVVIFLGIYPIVVKWLPAFLAGHTSGRNEAYEYTIDNSMALQLLAILSIIGAIVGLIWGYKTKKQIVTLVAGSFLLILLGYTTYTQILLRSNANPPMNENEPKNFSSLSSYLGREQYGDAPMWPRRYQRDDYFIRNYVSQDENGNYIYGEWFPPEPKPVRRKNGDEIYSTQPYFPNINTSGELAYMWKYQMNHMYFRYFGWNFIGRQSDVQDAGVYFAEFLTPFKGELNYKSGYADEFPIKFYALPFIFGLLGLLFHFYRDPKMAFSYLILFLMLGILATLQQNQQDPQPRERDYFYAGSFLVWAIWIGMGAFSIIDYFSKQKITTVIASGLLGLSVLLVPINMAANGWKIHSRAGNYLPFDYSYNILQSCEQNAILFTYGDNDTFPLWWLQDVAGVRRDVRIVNLSLGNTLWYVDQAKNRQPWGAEKIPLSFEDKSIQLTDEADPYALSYSEGDPEVISFKVREEIMKQYTNDPAILNDRTFSFTFMGQELGQRDNKPVYRFRVQDKLVADIIKNVKFERPVYFSTTVSPDNFVGLESYLRLEGMAFKICPVPQRTSQYEAMNLELMEKCLVSGVDNSNNYSPTQRYGFKFRNLNNPSVYYDEVHRRLMSSYRSLFVTYASQLLLIKKENDKAIAVLEKMNEFISPVQFPMAYDLEYRIAKLYNDAGAKDKSVKYADMAIKSCNEIIKNRKLAPDAVLMEASSRYLGPHRYASMLYEMKGDFANAAMVLDNLKNYAKALLDEVKAYGNTSEVQQVEMNLLDLEANISNLDISEVESKQGAKAALNKAIEKLKAVMKGNNPNDQAQFNFLIKKVEELKIRTGDTTSLESILAQN